MPLDNQATQDVSKQQDTSVAPVDISKINELPFKPTEPLVQTSEPIQTKPVEVTPQQVQPTEPIQSTEPVVTEPATPVEPYNPVSLEYIKAQQILLDSHQHPEHPGQSWGLFWDQQKGTISNVIGGVVEQATGIGDILSGLQDTPPEPTLGESSDSFEKRFKLQEDLSKVDPSKVFGTTAHLHEMAKQFATSDSPWLNQLDPNSGKWTVGTFLDPSIIKAAGLALLKPIATGKGILFLKGMVVSPKFANNTTHIAPKLNRTYKKALALEKAGNSADEIYTQTRWIKDPNTNNWMYDLPSHIDGKLNTGFIHKQLKIERSKRTVAENNDLFGYVTLKGKLSDFYDYPLLYEGYPELKNIDISIDIHNSMESYNLYTDETIGSFSEFKNKMYAQDWIEGPEGSFNLRSTIEHEIVHVIQWLDNLPRGGAKPSLKEFIDESKGGTATDLLTAIHNNVTYNVERIKELEDQLSIFKWVRKNSNGYINQFTNNIDLKLRDKLFNKDFPSPTNEQKKLLILYSNNFYRTPKIFEENEKAAKISKSFYEFKQRKLEQLHLSMWFLGNPKWGNPTEEKKAFDVFMDKEYRRLIGEIDARVTQHDLSMNRLRKNLLKEKGSDPEDKLDKLQSTVDVWFSLNPIQKREYLINEIEKIGGKDTSLFSWWNDDVYSNNLPLYISLMQYKLRNP